MSTPLLATKLFPPTAGPVVLPRPRLEATVAEAVQRPLTLVVAPAGYGKTTLVTRWIDSTEDRVAWLSLDAADDDPHRFWEYVVFALASVAPEAVEEARLRLEAPEADLGAVAVSVLNGFVDPATPRTVLVLDDVHLLERPDVIEGLATLIEQAPPALRLLLLTRSDPALALGRLRARGMLTELRQDDLRFRPEEVAAYLSEMGVVVSHEALGQLSERTEGWAASLQLAALSLERMEDADRAGFIADFSGNDRFVVDYLVDEVLADRSPEVHDFLLATSILDRMCERVCAVVAEAAGVTGTAPELRELERKGLFVLPLDRERRWYRYHHLFAELLRVRARARFDLDAARVSAARWFGEEGEVEEGMDYALAAGRTDVAQEILTAGFALMLGRGQLAAIRRAIARLPRPEVEKSLELCIAMGYVEHLSSRFEEGKVWADLARVAPRPEPRPKNEHEAGQAEGHLAVFESMRAAAAGDLDGVAEACARARAAFDGEWTERDFMMSVVEQSEALHAVAVGALDEAIRLGTSAWRRGFATGNRHAGSSGVQAAALAHEGRGDFHTGLRLIEAAAQSLGGEWGRHPIVTGYLQTRRAGLLISLGRLDEAEAILAEGLSAALSADVRNVIVQARAEEVRLALARGKIDRAAETGAGLLDLLESWTVSLLDRPRLEGVALQGMIAGGQTVDAIAWHRQLEDTVESRGWDVASRMTLARVHLAEGDARRAEQTAAEAVRRSEAIGAWGWFDAATVLRAEALEQLRDGKAVEVLLRAFPGMRERGHLAPLLIAGAPLLPVLSRSLATDEAAVGARWVATLQAQIEARGPGDEERLLSDRESEILAFLQAGLPNRSIADRLFLSIGTVKKHTHNIYSKLGVSSRTEAVARARELGLVE